MKLIVGLGNPEKKYEKTRHNVGWMVLDALAENQNWQESKKAHALYQKMEISGHAVELIKPTTYMNNSGEAVAYAQKKHNLEADDIIVVHDDKDIPLGTVKVQKERGNAGHNGVRSIVEHLKSNAFTRIRVGTASENKRKMEDTTKFVLGRFGILEKGMLRQAIETAIHKINELF